MKVNRKREIQLNNEFPKELGKYDTPESLIKKRKICSVLKTPSKSKKRNIYSNLIKIIILLPAPNYSPKINL